MATNGRLISPTAAGGERVPVATVLDAISIAGLITVGAWAESPSLWPNTNQGREEEQGEVRNLQMFIRTFWLQSSESPSIELGLQAALECSPRVRASYTKTQKHGKR